MPRPTALKTCLWSKVRVDLTTGCWEWTGAIQSDGYSQIRRDGRTRNAHRVAYEYFVGPVPAGLMLDHLCRVRHCINPEHLEPVTNKTNSQRGRGSLTHCHRGHEFTTDNTRFRRDGARTCKACDRRRVQAYKSRRATKSPQTSTGAIA